MKPLAVCAALALAVHAGLLWLPHRLHANGPAGGASQTLHARLEAAEPVSIAMTPPADADAATQIEPAQQASEAMLGVDALAAEQSEAPDRFAPLLDVDERPVRVPDASMPEHGADLRAYVHLSAQGQVDAVSVASTAEGLPIAFNEVVEAGLRQSHLRAALEVDVAPITGLAYCLAVRFEPDQPAPQLQWLPGAATSPALCLNAKLPVAARDIERR